MAIERRMQEVYYPVCHLCGWEGSEPGLTVDEAVYQSDAHEAGHRMPLVKLKWPAVKAMGT